jgi:hypothetical protein
MARTWWMLQCVLILAQVVALLIGLILSREMEKSLFSGEYSAYITFPIGLVICYPGTTFKYNKYVLLLPLLLHL